MVVFSFVIFFGRGGELRIAQKSTGNSKFEGIFVS